MKDKALKTELSNIKGKRMLEKNALDYCAQIVDLLIENEVTDPNYLSSILEDIGMSKTEFIDILAGKKQENVVFYEHTLSLIQNKGIKK